MAIHEVELKGIEVGALLKTETAYDKDMNLTFDGKEIRVILHWDDHDGFEMPWCTGEDLPRTRLLFTGH